ncbi:MAG: PQQ-binding-like beta-propeller repeat protein, partial [Bryobacteraceae bacterium]
MHIPLVLMPALLAIALPCIRARAQELPAKQTFAKLCAACHGEGATGTDRGPALVDNGTLRKRSASEIHDLIRSGTRGGMPAFPLPEEQLQPLALWVHSLNASAYDVKPAGDTGSGERFFFGEGKCATCHMIAGRGKVNGPDLSDIGRELTLGDLERALDAPNSRVGSHSSASCPSWAWCPQNPWAVVRVRLRDGSELRGFARGQGKHDLQLQTFDGRLHLLVDTEYAEVSREKTSAMPPLHASAEERRNLLAYLSDLGGGLGGIATEPVTFEKTVEKTAERDTIALLEPRPGAWPTYNGNLSANRHSALNQIDTGNVSRLELQWSYSLPYSGLEMTPLVGDDGVMYVTGPNQVCALDSRTGHEIWCYSRPRTAAGTIAGDAAKGVNRGAALLGDRVFFATDNAHLICLNRLTGGLMWDVTVPETPGHYGSTAAPLVVGDLVITGVAGADEGIRGFVAAYRATTGQLAWRFWTVPKPGEPASETWKGNAIDLGGGSTWLSGSYDPETGLLYWGTGNPFPDTDGDERGGANLYTNCVIALDAKTGKLRWHYQFTPHDLHDWDATEPL